MTPPNSALVVEPSLVEAISLVSMLSQLGFRVTVSDNFREAKSVLLTRPTLLITELRLGEYNGLHLVLRGKSTRPDMAAIVTSRIEDSVLYAEAERLGATFVQKGIVANEFRATVCRTLFRRPAFAAEPIRPPFERRKDSRRTVQFNHHRPERRISERRRDITAFLQHSAARAYDAEFP